MRGVLSRGGLGRLGSLCVYAVRSRRDGPGSREKRGRLGSLCVYAVRSWRDGPGSREQGVRDGWGRVWAGG